MTNLTKFCLFWHRAPKQPILVKVNQFCQGLEKIENILWLPEVIFLPIILLLNLFPKLFLKSKVGKYFIGVVYHSNMMCSLKMTHLLKWSVCFIENSVISQTKTRKTRIGYFTSVSKIKYLFGYFTDFVNSVFHISVNSRFCPLPVEKPSKLKISELMVILKRNSTSVNPCSCFWGGSNSAN